MNRLDEVIKREFGADISVLRRIPVSWGDINRAYALELSDGNKVFMKANSRSNTGFFRAEAEGLAALKQTDTVRIPEVIDIGEDGSSSFLLLEFIESGIKRKGSSEELGTGLAAMHMAAAEAYAGGGQFGFSHDNYIGAGEQINSPRDTWTEFFIECRLLPQFERAAAYFDRGERKKIDSFLSRADNYLVEPDHPSLLHGDLWSGNYMIDRDGHPWLIDPAVYVGHAEADLAMTELFGGFDRTFYEAYRSTAGIDPGYKDRKDLYNLYHMLNHLNLFGGGYLYSVRSIINRYI
jgi:fructosamine-3-kinase